MEAKTFQAGGRHEQGQGDGKGAADHCDRVTGGYGRG